MAAQRPPATGLSPGLALILARMVEAKLAAQRGSQPGRLTVSSDDPRPREPQHEGRRHAR